MSSFDGRTVFPALLKQRGIEVLDTVSFQPATSITLDRSRAPRPSPRRHRGSALYNEAVHAVSEIRSRT